MNDLILNNNTYEIKVIHLTKEQDPSEFFNWCLSHHLYKKEDGFVSRMKRVYEFEKEWNGLSAVVATFEHKPIGICLLEHKIQDEKPYITRAGILHTDNRVRKDPWQIKLKWDFIHAGFMSFYIDKKHRNQGIASKLLKEMEELQYHFLSKTNIPNIEGNCIVVTARELANSIVKKSNLFHAVDVDTFQGNYLSALSSCTYDIYFSDKPKKSIEEFKAIGFDVEILNTLFYGKNKIKI